MTVSGSTHVDGPIHTVYQVTHTSTIQEVEKQPVTALEMPEVVLLEVVVAAVVVVDAVVVVAAGVAVVVVDAEVVEVNFVILSTKNCD